MREVEKFFKEARSQESEGKQLAEHIFSYSDFCLLTDSCLLEFTLKCCPRTAAAERAVQVTFSASGSGIFNSPLAMIIVNGEWSIVNCEWKYKVSILST